MLLITHSRLRSTRSCPRLRLSPFLVRRLLKIPNDGRLILHLHGLWTYVSYVTQVLSLEAMAASARLEPTRFAGALCTDDFANQEGSRFAHL